MKVKWQKWSYDADEMQENSLKWQMYYARIMTNLAPNTLPHLRFGMSSCQLNSGK